MEGEEGQSAMAVATSSGGTPEKAAADNSWTTTDLTGHPVITYLSMLAASSQRTMYGALDKIAEIASGGRCNAISFNWAELRYKDTVAIRAILVKRYAPTTANKMLCALRRTLKEAWRLELISSEEYRRATDIGSVKVGRQTRGRMVSLTEITLLLENCAQDETVIGRRDAAMIFLMMAGLRREEVSLLNLEDFNPHTGALLVRNGKGNESRTTYLVGNAVATINEWLSVRGTSPGPLIYPSNKSRLRLIPKRIEPQTVRTAMRTRAKMAGVEYFSPHDLRRTCITLLLDNTDLLTVQKIAGHKSPVTTMRYDRRGETAKIKAMELIALPQPTKPRTIEGTDKER